MMPDAFNILKIFNKEAVNETLTFGKVKNLWSVKRNNGPMLVFLGHVDVAQQVLKMNGVTLFLDMMMVHSSMVEVQEI